MVRIIKKILSPGVPFLLPLPLLLLLLLSFLSIELFILHSKLDSPANEFKPKIVLNSFLVFIVVAGRDLKRALETNREKDPRLNSYDDGGHHHHHPLFHLVLAAFALFASDDVVVAF